MSIKERFWDKYYEGCLELITSILNLEPDYKFSVFGKMSKKELKVFLAEKIYEQVLEGCILEELLKIFEVLDQDCRTFNQLGLIESLNALGVKVSKNERNLPYLIGLLKVHTKAARFNLGCQKKEILIKDKDIKIHKENRDILAKENNRLKKRN